MKLLNTLLIIFGLGINQVLCNTIEDEILERFERGLIDISPEKIKNLLRNGDSDLGVPIFDPYIVENRNLSIVEDNLIVIGKLHDVSIRGLSYMSGIDTDHDFWRRRIKLSLTFPYIFSTGNYSIDRIRTDILTHTAYGNYTVVIRDVAVTVTLEYAITKSTVSLDELQINNIESMEIYATGEHDYVKTGLVIIRNGDTEENGFDFSKRFRITDFIIQVFGDSLRAILDDKSIPQVKKMLG